MSKTTAEPGRTDHSEDDAYETLPKAAARWGVSPDVLRSRIENGILPAVQINTGQRRVIRVKRSDVAALFTPFEPTGGRDR